MSDQPRIRILELSFLALLAALGYGFYLVMEPFILNIFLAAVFTSVLFPFYERVCARLGDRPRAASVAVVLIAFVAVAIPATLVGVLVYSEAVSGYQALVERLPEIERRVSEIRLVEWAQSIPGLGAYAADLEEIDLFAALQEVISNGSGLILSITQRGVVTLASAFANVLVILLLMIFFFAGGRKLLATAYRMLPFPNHELREIAVETRRTTTATLISTVMIGIMEGTLGIVLFLIFGLPSPFLWGVIIVVVSMIPLIGTNLIIVPAGIGLIVSGRVVAGLLVIAAGVAGVATTQNVIKPKLLGDRSGLHPALALLTTIGGIAWMGIIGFLVGPLIASLFLVVWQQFAIRYREEFASRNRTTAGSTAGAAPRVEAAPRVGSAAQE